ncbi:MULTISPECIES: non-homologous end-joining DNA ligase [unclassified Microbacterium]|uniref:non-homologous end-joining DNA ligase n=1 Tax=unclassified Microbacterium TaxID=2609290 RepID=UPI000EA9CC25|nr:MULTISPECIES: non-homologous end-joining DNA ligase [unclassified Microbacterium]MBT2486754.1 non-homologous end-joining DNA ligase [Microbacterium sp. ISL-108]RKN64684.1 ATP-dependent DNA ligase [Microbacterium sp. CGR2]
MVGEAQVVQVDGRRLRVTNLDKVVYPESGTTKGEIIAYYSTIAPLLLPLVDGRPVTRKRWVDGVGPADAPADAFFAKQLEPGAPEWIPRQAIQHSDGPKEYPLVEDVPTLVWLAQVAAIELHVPQWRFAPDGLPGRPDRLVLDLDPGPGVGLAQCAEAARIARGILTDMGLDPRPVTSGSKGIHLYAALPGEQTSDEISAVVKELARLIENDHPDLATSVMTKAVRGGKVFLDWSQNNGKKTTISPYSLRGRARPWVAAPRTWDELDDPDLAQLDIDEVVARAAAGIDPLSDLRPDGPALPREASGPPTATEPTPPASARRASRYARSAPAAASEVSAATLAPMLAENGTPALARTLSDPSWAEVKWDGIRAIGTWSDQRMLLHARRGTDITARYPELTADGAPFFPVADAVVDGEIVAFDAKGRPSFSLLQNRMHLTRPREIEREVVRTPIVYMLFDLLRLDGHDLTAMPLRERRTLLEDLVADVDAPVQVPPVFDDVDAALATSEQFGLEGVVVKDPDSRYRSGQRSPHWLKLKHTRMQEAVIVGIRPGKGDRQSTLGSLLLAVPEGSPNQGALRYIGRVGSGFTDRILRDLLTRLEPLRVTSAPLAGVPAPDASDALWVRPELVGEVEFANWTPNGILRHARWRGLRPDKSPDEIVVEP